MSSEAIEFWERITAFVGILPFVTIMYKSLFNYLAVLLINFSCGVWEQISTLVNQISLFILLQILLED